MLGPENLHPYQRRGVAHIIEHARCAIWIFMGGGKTATVLTALDRLNLVEDVFPALALAPLRVAQNTWPDEPAKWSHLNHLRISAVVGDEQERLAALRVPADVYTTNYEQIPWLVELYGKKWPFKTIIADECFPTGTRVKVPNGSVNIEEIKVGDTVGTHLGFKKVTRVFTKLIKPSNLVSLKLSNGVEIVATREHPFFTDMGWLAAGACGNREFFSSDQMPHLQYRLREESQQSQRKTTQKQNPVLLQKMQLNRYFREQPRIKNQEQPTNETNSCGYGYELEQRDTLVGGATQERFRCGESKGSDDPNKGRERHRNVGDRSPDKDGTARRFQIQLRSCVESWLAPLRLSHLLQNRFRESAYENGFRDRRELPSSTGPQENRQEETGKIRVIRVDDYADNERRSMVAVFNLEVEEAHTYFVEDILVHNCTKTKSFRLRQGGKRMRALGAVAHKYCTRFIELTGTPSPNGIKDLWGMTWFLDQGERLGRTFSMFMQRWFKIGYDGFTVEPLAGAQAEIEEKLRDICMSFDPKDYFDLKEPIERVIYIDLPPAARKLYNDMERDMFMSIARESIDEDAEVEAFNAASRTGKCLQLANGAAYINGSNKEWEEVHTEKIKALESIVEETGGAPLLVAYSFVSDLERLRSAFPSARILDKRPETIREWNAGKIPILLAHPASAGHGLNLQDGGHHLVFFSSGWNLELDQQIIERIGPVRQRQSGYDRHTYIYRIVARNTIEQDVIERLKTKATVQETLIKAMKART